MMYSWGFVLWVYNFNTLNTGSYTTNNLNTGLYPNSDSRVLLYGHETSKLLTKSIQQSKHQYWYDLKDIQNIKRNKNIYTWIHLPEELRDLSGLTNSQNTMKWRHNTFCSNFLQRKVLRKKYYSERTIKRTTKSPL